MRYRSYSVLVASLLLSSACMVSTSTVRRGGPPPPPPPREHHHDGDHRPPPPVQQERFLEGTVTDAVTGRPLPKAGIDIVDPQSRTQTVSSDANGYYRTGTLPPGKFAIRCRLDGYEAYQQGYSITDGPARLDCRLQPKRR